MKLSIANVHVVREATIDCRIEADFGATHVHSVAERMYREYRKHRKREVSLGKGDEQEALLSSIKCKNFWRHLKSNATVLVIIECNMSEATTIYHGVCIKKDKRSLTILLFQCIVQSGRMIGPPFMLRFVE
jgi:hypothetical protein